MSDPSAGLGAIKRNAQQGADDRYAQVPNQISRSLSSRGYGSSGNFGNTMYQAAFAHNRDLGDIDSQFAQLIANQKNTGASLSEQLLGMTRGSTTTSTGPNTSLSDGFMSAGNGLNSVATMLTLSKLLKGGGSGNNGAFGNGSYLPSGMSYNVPYSAPAADDSGYGG